MTKSFESSDTTTRDTHGPASRLALFLFKISLIFFLIAGLCIVVGQAGALIGGDATLARTIKTVLAPYAFGGASVAGILAYLLSYRQDVEALGAEHHHEVQHEHD
jgi:hypothetical protein